MTTRRSCLTVAASLAGSLALASAGAAQTSPPSPRMVVELFTSQGCSSCPPADALLADLAKQPDVIAISLPVDYWDYLGWKDTLASHANTMRQKGYSVARGDRQVYTPQAVVNGVAHAVGSKRGYIEKAASASLASGAMRTRLALTRDGDRWTLALPATTLAQPAQLLVMPVTRKCEVAIGRGENADRKIAYTNVVRAIGSLGEWDGSARTISIDPALLAGEDVDGFVVLAQTMQGGKPAMILGAVKSAGL